MIDELNNKYAIGEALVFSLGQGGLPRAEIKTPACRGEVYLHGAHVTRWRPVGHNEVLWLSARANFLHDMPIRGGIPICFPWFAGNKPADQPNAPSHGYARTKAWDITDTAATESGIAITLGTTIEGFQLSYQVQFGEQLDLALTVTNTLDQPRSFEEALHTYFTVSQIKQVKVAGLAGTRYTHTVGGANTEHTQQNPAILFNEETDRVYHSPDDVTVHDPGLNRSILIKKESSASTVVWNPWINKAAAMSDFGDDEWPGMLCVESANIKPNAVTLGSDASHTMGTSILVRSED